MFNICFASRESVPYFAEVARLLQYSLEDLGRPCRVSVGEVAHDAVNILLDYHKISNGETLSGYRYVPLQLEQLADAAFSFDERRLALLENALCVWEYSTVNIDFLKPFGLPVQHLPMGWHPRLDVLARDAPKDIDVLFYGFVNDRRKRVLEALLRAGVKLRVLQGVFGRERDACIARAKMVLNVHYYESGILETVRLAYLLNNGAFVLTERAAVDPYAGLGLASVPYEKLVPACGCSRTTARGRRRRAAAVACSPGNGTCVVCSPRFLRPCRPAGRSGGQSPCCPVPASKRQKAEPHKRPRLASCKSRAD